MNTDNIFSKLVKEFSSTLATMDLNIGDRENETNSISFDMEGWFIEVEFDVTGVWDCWQGFDNVYGEVTELILEHYNEETGEDDVISDEDIRTLREEINYILKNLS